MEKTIIRIVLSLMITIVFNHLITAQHRNSHEGSNLKSINGILAGYISLPAPIKQGNIWVSQTYDLYVDSQRISEKTISINNKIFNELISDGYNTSIYVRLDTSSFYEMYRADMIHDSTITIRYYKKDARIGDTWKDSISTNIIQIHTVTDTGWMYMYNVKVFNVKVIHVTDSLFVDDWEYWSDEFGLLYSYRSEEGGTNLIACRIDGNDFGAINYLPTGIKNIAPFEKKFALSPNYPNPFNPSTMISYQLAEVSKVVLKVYDVLGNETAVLVNAEQNEGLHMVRFKGNNFRSGVYFYTLQAGNFKQTRKMAMIR